MALTYSEPVSLGQAAPDFTLRGVDGKTYSLASFKASRALVVVFMCNHCPYVQAVQDRINALAREYSSKGVALVGINSNDAIKYPDDNFDSMKRVAGEKGYVFPYLWDETQAVAKAYGAVCTPDFYLYSRDSAGHFVLQYRGRLDDNWKNHEAVTKRDLAEAIDSVLTDRTLPKEQSSSMGCSIKWK